MKTKFYRRLVPLALIVSMAATNVGVTGISANAQTPQAIVAVTDGGDKTAPVVGTPGVASTSVNVVFANSTDETGTATITITEKDAGWTTAGNFKLYDSAGSAEIGTATSIEGDAVSFTVAKSTLSESGTKYSNAKLAYSSGLSTTIISEAIVLTAQIPSSSSGGGSSTTTTTTVAAGDVFQIPGGLVANATKQETYKVGVAKVIAHSDYTTATTVNATTNPQATVDAYKAVNVDVDEIVEANGASTDTTLGKWENSYVGTGANLKLKPEKSACIGKFALYYEYKIDDTHTKRIFVRLLSEAEQEALPLGDFKSEATLTKIEESDTTADAKQAKDEWQYMYNNASGVKSVKALVAELFTGNAGDVTGWDKVFSGFAKGQTNTADEYDSSDSTNADKTAYREKRHLMIVPGVTATTAALKNDSKLVEKLIEAYDKKYATETNGTVTEAKKFVNQFTRDADATATPPVEAHTPNNTWSNVALCNEQGVPNETGLQKLGALILIDDNFELLGDDSCGAETKKLYSELVAFAKAWYINKCNRTIYDNGPVLTKLHWVLETKEGASEEVTTKSGKKTEYTKTSGAAKFWGKKLKKVTDKKTKVTSWKAEEKDSSCARVQGASVEVSNTKANGNFNASVFIKAVSDKYDTPTAKVNKTGAGVILKDSFYIPPAVPTAFTDKSLSKSASKKGVEFASVAAHFDASDATKRIYTLKLDVGKSFKLPFALKDGKDKALVYEVDGGSNGFTVVNGKVTAFAANGATLLADTANIGTDLANAVAKRNYIKVYSRTSPDVYAYVQVQVNPAVKSIVANAKKVGMWKGAEQYVSLGTNPALNPTDVKYFVENGDTATYDVVGYNGSGSDVPLGTGGELTAGVNVLKITTKPDKDPAKATITVNVKAAGGTDNLTSKPLTINLSPVSAPQDIKTAKATVKAKNGAVNIPEGSAVNLGFTVTPVGAHTAVADGSGNICQNGDVLTGNGNVYTVGSLSDTFKAGKNVVKSGSDAQSNITVNTYNPGASIALTDDNYTIKGGFLMTSSAAATDCDREFKAGNQFAMKLPSAGTDEEIIWKSNNPAAVKFDTVLVTAATGIYANLAENDKALVITPCQTGTFTITGTTKYTKQKLTFKMLVGAKNDASDIPTTFTGAIVDGDGDGIVPNGGKYEISAGAKYNAFMYAGTSIANGVGGPVKFALKNAADKDKATVSKNGEIKAKAGGEVTIVATMTKPDKSSLGKVELTLKIAPVAIEAKSIKAPAGVIKGKEFALSASLKNFNKKTMELKWTASKDGATATDLTAMPKDKPSGKVKFTEPGTYTIEVQAYDKTTKAPITVTGSYTINVVVYDKAINAANTNGGDADAKKAIAALGAKYEDTDAKKNNGVGYGYVYVPIFLTMKDTAGKTVPYDGTLTANDIVWTSSNKNLAEFEEFMGSNAKYTRTADDTTTNGDAANDKVVEESDIIKGYKDATAVAKIKVANDREDHYTGNVTIKGVTKNSKKTISIKLNVLDKKRAFVAEYNPQTFANDTNLTLANIDDSAVKKDLANVGSNADAINKAITDAAGNKNKDKTFVMNKWVLVNSTNLKEVNKDTEHKVAEPWQATVNKDLTSGNVKVNFVSANMLDANNGPVSAITAKAIRDAGSVTAGTWYLAVAEVTYKVKQVAVEADPDATPAVQAKPLLLEETGIKVTKIASKTPIVKASS